MVVGKIGSGAFPANDFSDADRDFLLGTAQRLGYDIGETLNNPGLAPSRDASGTWGGAIAPQPSPDGWLDMGGGVRIRERR
jgi:hypothetical protein